MNDKLIEFATQFFGSLRIQAKMVDHNNIWDKAGEGLREAILKDEQQIKSTFPDIEFSNSTHSVLIIRDIYGISYILIDCSKKEVFRIGPYIHKDISIDEIFNLEERLNIPSDYHEHLIQYFVSLPLLSDQTILMSFLDVLASNLFESGNYVIRRLRFDKRKQDLDYRSIEDNELFANTAEKLEKRYQMEETMMEAVASGNYEKAVNAINKDVFMHLEQRNSDSIRDRKNYMLAYNTLLRKAAERGHVHPVYLDAISRKNAILIERCINSNQIDQLHDNMMKEYCDLVRRNTTSTYSPLIQKTVNYINMNLELPLSLSKIAEQMIVSKVYLSSQFKKETGVTLTDYVTSRRLGQAAYLLELSDLSVQDIAVKCGYNDFSYFGKLFKEKYGLTASAYRKEVRDTNK